MSYKICDEENGREIDIQVDPEDTTESIARKIAEAIIPQPVPQLPFPLQPSLF